MASKSAFDRYVDAQKKDPAFAAEYERMGVEIRAVDDFVRRVGRWFVFLIKNF